jgi:AbiV family abortive infection protein
MDSGGKRKKAFSFITNLRRKILSNKFSLYAQASKLSLENAKQLIKDAKLLLKNSSFGHASALIRLAVEESTKALVCWFTSEKIFPIENKLVIDVFKYHKVKNEFFLGFLSGWMNREKFHSWRKLMESIAKLSQEQISEAPKEFQKMIASTDEMRHRAMYVNLKGTEVETPLEIGGEESKNLLIVAEFFLNVVRHIVEKFPEKRKAELRGFFSKIPKEYWKTGELPPNWLPEVFRDIF